MKPARRMNANGMPADGLPVFPGDRFVMVSGRITTPYPHQKGLKYNVQWLIDNAVAEATANQDTFNHGPFGRINPKTPSMSDLESLIMYLFEYQPTQEIQNCIRLCLIT